VQVVQYTRHGRAPVRPCGPSTTSPQSTKPRHSHAEATGALTMQEAVGFEPMASRTVPLQRRKAMGPTSRESSFGRAVPIFSQALTMQEAVGFEPMASRIVPLQRRKAMGPTSRESSFVRAVPIFSQALRERAKIGALADLCPRTSSSAARRWAQHHVRAHSFGPCRFFPKLSQSVYSISKGRFQSVSDTAVPRLLCP